LTVEELRDQLNEQIALGRAGWKIVSGVWHKGDFDWFEVEEIEPCERDSEVLVDAYWRARR